MTDDYGEFGGGSGGADKFGKRTPSDNERLADDLDEMADLLADEFTLPLAADRLRNIDSFMQRLRDGWEPDVDDNGEWWWVRDTVAWPMSERHAALYRRGEGT